ncbi:MAG: HAD family phosphatase [Candidatus Aenigmarchaeota archaeon]|nr:HAD family phosphatase [Candidatus Aenigmarchaeota archaeon]
MINTVIFDMDGVLIDSAPHHYEVLKDFMGEHGVEITIDDFREFNGTTTKEVIEYLSQKHVKDFDVHAISVEKEKRAWKKISEEAAIFDGVCELIQELKENGFKIALATSTELEYAEHFFRMSGLKSEFDAIVTKDDVRRSKPDPEIFQVAAKKVGSKPEECVVIEDASNGVKAAHAAGMKCIGIKSEFSKPEKLMAADKVVDSIRQINIRTIMEL